jgi:hypothetical protein
MIEEQGNPIWVRARRAWSEDTRNWYLAVNLVVTIAVASTTAYRIVTSADRMI